MAKQTPKQIDVPFARNVIAQLSDDGEDIALRFETVDAGPVNVALTGASLTKLIMLLLQQSEKVAIARASKKRPESSDVTIPSFNPIVCSAIGIAKGRTESEIALMVEVGPTKFVFVSDRPAIEGLCRDFHDLDDLDTGIGRQH